MGPSTKDPALETRSKQPMSPSLSSTPLPPKAKKKRLRKIADKKSSFSSMESSSSDDEDLPLALFAKKEMDTSSPHKSSPAKRRKRPRKAALVKSRASSSVENPNPPPTPPAEDLPPATALRRAIRSRAPVAQRNRAYASVLESLGNFRALAQKSHPTGFSPDRPTSPLLGGNLKRLLKQEKRTVTFRVAPRMTSRAGHLLSDSRRPKWHELAISPTLLDQSFERKPTGKNAGRRIVVNGCECKTKAEAFVRVVEHEMLHLLFVCDSMPAACRSEGHHGATFQAAARNIFNHKDFRHDLVTPWEQAANEGIRGGSMVRFQYHGKSLVGRVNRVTKRATILVKAKESDRDAMPFSDG
eukprot:CAMPEP_0167828904 /NCGR_PEP_ID=MMETSP0112_2-20121227/11776_1 /TAXON_ID=91324 /ORGANISM="Lotharella globosa, Strain CCCM811" /LENGTH=355 /DNA_ID=CAMNT_0007732365 /DNA_START=138 /DNA_END=1200 /DNA_ORIENTATION=-